MTIDLGGKPTKFDDLPDGTEVPYVITQRIPRNGFIYWIARLFRRSWGWTYKTESGIGTIYKI
jgi:hypothetical protein